MRKIKTSWIALAATAFIAQAGIDQGFLFEKWRKSYAPKVAGMRGGLSPDQFLLALTGFREMIAGILWVQADSFFDTGNYDAILPIVRLVTWLDPHQVDVYTTGMWHIGYNFTDEESRSDRRYIPSALALGKEGCQSIDYSYEMFFETGWIWYHKVDDDYPQAVKYLEKAVTFDDMLPARKNLLSNTYQRNGQVEEGMRLYADLWRKADEHQKTAKADFQAQSQADTIENNLDTMLVRMGERGYFGRKNKTTPTVPYATDPPFDTKFSVRVTVPEPRVVRFEGTWAVLPVGTRIRVVLRDKDYPGAKPAELDWDASDSVDLDPPKDLTFMQDQLYVKNRRFDRTCDMGKDPTMYPFKADDYLVEFYYNPRSAAVHIMDKFSWNGEGFTDSNFLSLDARPGQRVMYTNLKLTRDMILRRGEWVNKMPEVTTPNYSFTGTKDKTTVISVPSLLSEGQNK